MLNEIKNDAKEKQTNKTVSIYHILRSDVAIPVRISLVRGR